MKEKVKNNKKKILSIAIVLLIIISGIILILINKPPQKEEKNDQKVSEIKKEEKTHFFIKDEQSLYIADNNYFKDGTKKLITDKAHELTPGVLYNDKYYYANNENKLIVYNIKDQSSTEYSFEGVELHANTLILPGEEYTIITESFNFVRIDMKNKTSKKLDIKSNNLYILYDDTEKILYYLNNNILNKYDVKNDKELGTLNIDGGPVIVDEEFVYFDIFNANGIEKYNKKTGEITRLNITDHWPGTQSIGVIIKKDNKLFLLQGGQDKLIKYDNGEETIIIEGEYLYITNIGNNIYIKSNLYSSDSYEYYIYDINNNELTKTDNEHIKYILDKINN